MAIPDACASLVLAFAALDRPLPLPPRAFPFGGPVMNVGPTLLDMYHNKERTTPRGRSEKRDFFSPLACGRSVSPRILEGAGSADRQTQGCPEVGSQATLPYLPPKSLDHSSQIGIQIRCRHSRNLYQPQLTYQRLRTDHHHPSLLGLGRLHYNPQALFPER